MANIDVPVTHTGFGKTTRRDNWWLPSFLVFMGLGAFLVYANWAAFQNAHYRWGPFYSPELFGSEHAWFVPKPV